MKDVKFHAYSQNQRLLCPWHRWFESKASETLQLLSQHQIEIKTVTRLDENDIDQYTFVKYLIKLVYNTLTEHTIFVIDIN